MTDGYYNRPSQNIRGDEMMDSILELRSALKKVNELKSDDMFVQNKFDDCSNTLRKASILLEKVFGDNNGLTKKEVIEQIMANQILEVIDNEK